ncbi:angiopoietin-related protein 1-like [Anopheles aquasalis]|uniref:angiopoietin-related protein 1-like n=1 Tax=Anopheles aquasalis TaxID=42839 RepID=UPI00215A9D69|nr:angiopoietin-related protein 1-like [Anopheles aquasalis]
MVTPSTLGYGLELLLTKFDIISSKLQGMEVKLQSVEDKVQRIEDKLQGVEDKQTNENLKSLTVDGSSCKNVPSKLSGTYLIRVKNNSEPFEVYCEQKSFGGGWIVFQFRYDGSEDFYRGWNEFRDGFGDVNDEFWLGLEKVHQITNGRKHELIVELKDFSGTYKYARYDAFEIGSESEQYVLKELGKHTGTTGDAMFYNSKGRKFSAKDRDIDESSYFHCAQYLEGAWWHSTCTLSHLNGRYMTSQICDVMFWRHFQGDCQVLSYSRMMIRELE